MPAPHAEETSWNGWSSPEMSMLLNPRRLDDVVILDLSGRITMGEGTLVLRDRIRKLLAAGDQKFLLNLADVDYIDSSGLGELVSSFTTVRNRGGQPKLLNLTRRVQDLLQIPDLLTDYEAFDNDAA